MRDILFRGKRKDNGEWVEGCYICDPDLDYHYISGYDYYSSENGWERESYCYEVDPETVGQWTGMYDNTKWEDLTEKEREEFTRNGNFPSEWNGKKIFEGDVVEIDGKHYEVKYMLGQFFVGINMPIAYKRFDCEVIGNIHDNPELLQMKG